MENAPQTLPRLAYFPVSFFAMVMGLSGLTIGWERLQALLQLDLGLTPWLLGITGFIFGLLLFIYALKILLYRAEVVRELHHPIRLSFFPTISISLLLLAVATLPVSHALSKPLWIAGASLHLLFTLYILSVWIHHEHFQIHHLNPAWFIPAVGNVVVPIAGVPLGHLEISWFFFSIGMLFWLILLVIVFNRILFHHPLDAHLMPTLFILIAPPAVGFISYLKLVGSLDSFGRILYFAGLFLTILLFTQIRRFIGLRFFLSWWAYSFPLAAIGIASLSLFHASHQTIYLQLGSGLVMLLSGVILILLIQTAQAVGRQAICVPDQGPGAHAHHPPAAPGRVTPWLIVAGLALLFAAGVWLAIQFAPTGAA
ncbi:C4-dicarboxylate ABC transporter [Caldichromatium japonicum]|uniref:C4-dicarboxylate ABC transporter n=1 Tax=Caldichromatium japonicum TaxID=2699430 RepID=A0A6G7VEI4_9GAMM|nr:SLAC1 anion channel family protein [Caldichromatium japonicum]QIK38362.1 C4-dicarboxylate ABC transporter [Caldichromatium japonicum]